MQARRERQMIETVMRAIHRDDQNPDIVRRTFRLLLDQEPIEQSEIFARRRAQAVILNVMRDYFCGNNQSVACTRNLLDVCLGAVDYFYPDLFREAYAQVRLRAAVNMPLAKMLEEFNKDIGEIIITKVTQLP